MAFSLILEMFKNLNCGFLSSGLFNSQNLLIFKFRNSKFLKENFVNKLKKLECL